MKPGYRKRMEPIWFVLRLLTLVLFYLVTVEGTEEPLSEKTLDSLIDQQRECHNIAGLAMGIISENQNADSQFAQRLRYARGFGTKNSKHDNVTTDTLFCMGSISKQFGSALIMKLLRKARDAGMTYDERSLLKVFDPSLDFPGSNLRDVTIEDALSHRTGLTAVEFLHMPHLTPKNLSDLVKLTARIPRSHPNREYFRYNNDVVNAVGHVTEILAKTLPGNRGTRWDEILRQYLLEPMGISDRFEFIDNNPNLDRIAAPFFPVNGTPVEWISMATEINHQVGPSSSVCISTEAMIEWMYFLLGRGTYKGENIMEAEDIENLWQPRISLGERSYGLNWYNGTYRGLRYVEHYGMFPPYNSQLTVFVDHNISLFTTANTVSPIDRRALHFHIFDRLMGYTSPYKIECKKFPARPPRILDAELNLKSDEYVGNYVHEIYGRLEIVKETSGTLRFLMGSSGNATIHCIQSVTKCELQMFGSFSFLSDSDIRSDPLIFFAKNEGEHAYAVTLPWFSDVMAEFQWIDKRNDGNGVGSHTFCMALFLVVLSTLIV